MTKRDSLNCIDFDSLIKLNYNIKLIRNNKYFTKKDFANALARNLSIKECEQLSTLFKQNLSITEISEIFLTLHKSTGDFLRNKFIDYLITTEIKGKLHNDILFFEFPVKEKRTDITRINGYSYAYEIKSIRDNFSRLKSQTDKFLSVFDYVYLIVEDTNMDIDLDNRVGIINVIKNKEIINFECIRKAQRTKEYNSAIQLNLLQKSELIKISRKYGFLHNGSRKQIEQSILKKFNQDTINILFKNIIKSRYKPIWLRNLKYFLA